MTLLHEVTNPGVSTDCSAFVFKGEEVLEGRIEKNPQLHFAKTSNIIPFIYSARRIVRKRTVRPPSTAFAPILYGRKSESRTATWSKTSRFTTTAARMPYCQTEILL